MNISRRTAVLTTLLIACLLFSPYSACHAEDSKAADCEKKWDLNLFFGPAQGFTRMDGNAYLGGDGFYTVDLTDGRILVLFGDTFIGKLKNLKRELTGMVNNSVAIIHLNENSEVSENSAQRGSSGSTVQSVKFYTTSNSPLFPAPSPNTFYWPLDGVLHNDVLYLFAVKIEKTDSDKAFGFREAGNTLFAIRNWAASPDRWEPEPIKIPHGAFGKNGYIMWGSSILPWQGGHLIYGVWCENGKKRMVLARSGGRGPEAFSDWRFYSKKNPDDFFKNDLESPSSLSYQEISPLLTDISNEFTVLNIGQRGFMLVTTPVGMSPYVQVRISPNPVFDENCRPLNIYRCPEHGMGKNIFTYSAKALRPMSDEKKVTLVYFSNSFDFWEPLRDLRLYWPKFLEFDLSRLPSPPACWESLFPLK